MSRKGQFLFRAADGVLSALAVMLGTVTISAAFLRVMEEMGQLEEMGLEEMGVELEAAVEAVNDPSLGIWIAGVLFLVLAVAHAVKIFYDPKADRLFRVRMGCITAAYLTVAALFLAGVQEDAVALAAVGCCVLELILNRAFAIVRKPKIRTVVLGSLRILFWVLVFWVVMEFQVLLPADIIVITVAVYLTVRALLHVMVLSFSRIRMDVLKNIIHKTYAGEILFGLVLLIFSFSIVFYVLEPDIATYWDGLWYAFALVTTIGFGDFSVTTHICRILSVILGIYGIVVVALITSIVVNFYSEVRVSGDE